MLASYSSRSSACFATALLFFLSPFDLTEAASGRAVGASVGPSTWRTLRVNYPIPEGIEKAGMTYLALTITTPGEGAPAAPHPVVFFFNGFALSADNYRPYAQGLAREGYVVVQYDFPSKWWWPLDWIPKSPDGMVEVDWLPGLLQWLSAHNADSSNQLGLGLYGKLDLNKIATAGHSRGGKIAALAFAENDRVLASYLIDPVNNNTMKPDEPLRNPNAIEALRAKNKTVGISGAGISSECNPVASGNYMAFYEASSCGSWREDVVQAGHADFCHLKWIQKAAFKWLGPCKGGPEPAEGAMELGLVPMLAWFNRQLHHEGSRMLQASADFRAWVMEQCTLRTIRFQTKCAAQPQANEPALSLTDQAITCQPPPLPLKSAKQRHPAGQGLRRLDDYADYNDYNDYNDHKDYVDYAS